MNEIICGDSMEVLMTIPDKSIDMVVTDPPYGFEWQSHRRKELHDKIENDSDLRWVDPIFREIYRVMKDDTVCISFYGWPDADIFVGAWKNIGFGLKSHIVFVKNNMGLGWFTRGKHESAYLLTKGTPAKPDVAIPDVLNWIGTGNELHPTQKPVDSMRKLIVTYSKEGDVILDPFAGSGTTCVAAKMDNRNYLGIEIAGRQEQVRKNYYEKAFWEDEKLQS